MLTVGLAVDTTIEAKGDPVGTPVGFRGAFDGDRLGFDVGCSDVKVEARNIMLGILKISIHTQLILILYTQRKPYRFSRSLSSTFNR